MKDFVQKIIRLRNSNFVFDDNIGIREVFLFSRVQFYCFCRGLMLLVRFKKPKGILLGRHVSFFNLSKIHWGRYLRLGDGVYVSALSKKGIQFGSNVSIGAYSRVVVSTSFNNIGEYIKIGNNVGIGEFAYLGGAGGLEIGNDCIVGQYLSCHPENHHFENLDSLIRWQGVDRKGITIGNNCWIGSKVTILDGVKIGDGCIIAAGSVVNKSFPDNSIIGGVPAKILKTRN